MSHGWVSVHRKILDNPIFKNDKLFRVFMFSLLKASHSDHQTLIGDTVVELKTGELITGREAISKATGLTSQNVRTALNKLKTMQILTIKSTNKYSIISITNWDQYQQTNQQVTNKQPASNQQLTTNNNTNKGNKGNNEDINTSQKPKVVCPHNEILKAWDETMPSHIARPNPELWTSGRVAYKHLRARWGEVVKAKNEEGALEWFKKFFVFIANKNPFLMNPESNFFNLAWMLKPDNFIKIREGNYQYE